MQVAARAVAGIRERVGAAADAGARRFWLLLLIESAVLAAAHAGHIGGSWHYFRSGADLLTDPAASGGGLHLYGAHPQLQIGPLALLVAWPFAQLPATAGRLLACAAMSLAGVALLALAAETARRPIAVQRRAMLVPGLLFMPVWTELALRFGHLDDVLALLLSVAAVRASRVSTGATAILLALAVGCKPWAVLFVPLLLAAPRHRRAIGLAAGAVVAVTPWLPFLLVDPHNLRALGYTITNAADSALRALGVDSPGTPGWCRPVQLILGVTLGVVAVRRGRPELVLLAGVSARLLLDPGTYAYYTAGFVAAAVVADVAAARRVPWFTVTAVGLLYLPAYLHVGPLAHAATVGRLRAGYLIAVMIAVAAAARSRPASGAARAKVKPHLDAGACRT